MTNIISGTDVAASIIEEIKTASEEIKTSSLAVTPGLAVIIVGDDPASKVYVAAKGKRASECGFHSVQHDMPATASRDDVLAKVHELNSDDSIHGILVQLPLPSHIDEDEIIQAISPHKDVDGFHYMNVGKVATGSASAAFVPCTPAGSMILLTHALGSDLSGLNAVVVGRSNIVGKPMANLLLQANATVTIAHSRTKNLPDVVRNADIVVAAVGRPEMIVGDWIKPGATIIDVGINRIERNGKHKLVGDVEFESARKVAAHITPVPGGVGPMTIAMLMQNTRLACQTSLPD